MVDHKKLLTEQLMEIDALLERSERNIMKLSHVPDIGINVHISNGHYQYRLVNKDSGEKQYVKNRDIPLIRKYAQKAYETKMHMELLALKHSLEVFLKHYDVRKLNEIYDRMANGKKALIEPMIESDESFIERWMDESYEEMPFYDNTEFFSAGGIRVRSKSELIIANTLEQCGIPYKYEKPLTLKGFGQVRPDFTCLHVKAREEVIWEHFGMMDNPAYANKNVAKLSLYHQNGFYVGKNLITSFETSQNPISSRLVGSMIEQYLI